MLTILTQPSLSFSLCQTRVTSVHHEAGAEADRKKVRFYQIPESCVYIYIWHHSEDSWGGLLSLVLLWIFLFWLHFIWFLVVIQVFVEATLDLHQEQSWDQLRCLYRGPSRVMTLSLCSSWRASSFTLLDYTQTAKNILTIRFLLSVKTQIMHCCHKN